MTPIKDRKPRPKKYTPTPEHDKAATVAAYCWGVLPLQSCARLFAFNPKWRRA